MNRYSFVKPDPTLRNNLMAFGFECNTGWYPLIKECFDELQEVIDNNPEYADFEVLQVKEKFAELRIYANYYYDELENIIDKYTAKSLTVCEYCGSTESVEMRENRGWVTTLCEKCYLKKT